MILVTCTKTEVFNIQNMIDMADTAKIKKPRTFTPRDTTDTTRHEITFSPTIIGWEVVDVETLSQEEVE